MLKIKNLCANVAGKEILKGIDLEIKKGEVHAIMGPNGSGKSTLSNILAGHEAYKVTNGKVDFEGLDLLKLEADERAKEGIFLAFQYPVEIPGVNNATFLRTALNEIRKHKGLPEISGKDFLELIREKMKQIGLNESLIQRSVNEGFSGGEKKRNEIFQLSVLAPKLALLDETDSGLDIDALKIVADGINNFKSKENAVLLVTHYQRLLNYIIPDFVHVLYKGKIIKTGGKELALELEERGYDWLINENESI